MQDAYNMFFYFDRIKDFIIIILTLFSHPHFETFLEPAMLALVSVMLIDGTVSTAATRIRQIATNGTFEETFATCKKK